METNILDKAVSFACCAHAGAFRKGTDIPYIVHPVEVMKIVCGLTSDEEVRAAAVLHDTLEDTPATKAQLIAEFGERVAALVCSESEDKREGTPEKQTWRVRKEETVAEQLRGELGDTDAWREIDELIRSVFGA